MNKINPVTVIAVIFISLAVVTTILGLSFQSSEHAGHSHEHSHEQQHVDSGEQEYTCSMHPSFRSSDPNERCPICGMELIPVAASGSDEELSAVEFSTRSLALLGLQTDVVQRGRAQRHVRLTGTLEFDERALTSISAWSGGRIERLHVNYTGASVEAEQPLVEIYSPDLLVAQQELLQAYRQAQSDAPAFLRESNQATLRAARERLRLLGLTGSQIDEVIERGSASDRVLITAPSSGLVVARNVSQGDYVNTGDTLLELADGQKMWAIFEVFERDLAYIEVGQHLQFDMLSAQQSFHGEVISVAPRIDPERRTRQVRVAIEQGEALLTAGAFVRATVQVNVEDVMFIPASAPLLTGKRAVVYVRPAEDASEFEPRDVELGRKLGDVYEVLSGLQEGELVVSRGAFRIDSELQLRGRPSMMAPQGNAADPHAHHGHATVQQHDEHSTDQDMDHTSHAQQAIEQVAFQPNLQLATVFAAYEQMWQALHSDDLSAWQSAAETFFDEIEQVGWPAALGEIESGLNTGAGHAHHVSSITTAREQFNQHSEAMIALARAGYHQGTLYLMYCPMAFSNQGAYWLQRDEQLLNPYFGARMLRCGDQVEVLSGQAHNDHTDGGH